MYYSVCTNRSTKLIRFSSSFCCWSVNKNLNSKRLCTYLYVLYHTCRLTINVEKITTFLLRKRLPRLQSDAWHIVISVHASARLCFMIRHQMYVRDVITWFSKCYSNRSKKEKKNFFIVTLVNLLLRKNRGLGNAYIFN